MTTTHARSKRRRRPERVLDPYVVQPHTSTREELLAARGITPSRHPNRRTPHPKAA